MKIGIIGIDWVSYGIALNLQEAGYKVSLFIIEGTHLSQQRQTLCIYLRTIGIKVYTSFYITHIEATADHMIIKNTRTQHLFDHVINISPNRYHDPSMPLVSYTKVFYQGYFGLFYVDNTPKQKILSTPYLQAYTHTLGDRKPQYLLSHPQLTTTGLYPTYAEALAELHKVTDAMIALTRPRCEQEILRHIDNFQMRFEYTGWHQGTVIPKFTHQHELPSSLVLRTHQRAIIYVLPGSTKNVLTLTHEIIAILKNQNIRTSSCTLFDYVKGGTFDIFKDKMI